MGFPHPSPSPRGREVPDLWLSSVGGVAAAGVCGLGGVGAA